MIVLDTNVWLWAVQGSPRLGKACRAALESERDRVYISAISIWEVGMYANRKKGLQGSAIQHWIEDALSIRALSVFELTPRVVCESMILPDFDFDHNDPAESHRRDRKGVEVPAADQRPQDLKLPQRPSHWLNAYA